MNEPRNHVTTRIRKRIPTPSHWHISLRLSQGFTLIEMLVVMAIIGLLTSLMIPAISKAKSQGRAVQCRANLAQLQVSFATYSDEMGHFPSNNYVTEISNDVLVSLSSWAPMTKASDQSTILGCLNPYAPFSKGKSIYRCPEDKGNRQTLEGRAMIPNLHSYNMNIWVNCLLEPFGYRTESELEGTRKSSSEFFVFIDTHPQSIIDPVFGIKQATGLNNDRWIDMPADHHNSGTMVSFLDGHVEKLSWKAAKVFEKNGQRSIFGPDREDQRMLQTLIPPPIRH